MRSTIGDRTFRGAQALSAEGRWARSYLKLFESAETQALKDRANRLYVIGELRQAAELLTQSGPAYPFGMDARPQGGFAGTEELRDSTSIVTPLLRKIFPSDPIT
jgi:hypothetical protein